MSHHPAIDIDQLLQMGAAAARSGNQAAARTLFLALARETPDDPRVWLGLADSAADPAEEHEALTRALALDPESEQAREALQRLAESPLEPAPTALAAPTPSGPAPEPASIALATPPTEIVYEAPHDADAEHRGAPFPLLNALSILLILLLLGALGLIIGRNLFSAQPLAVAPPATPAIAVAPPVATPASATPTAPPSPAPATAAPTAAPEAMQTPPPTGASPAPAPTALAPTSAPALTTELPLGQVVDYDGWSATLLRPDYAVALDGSIGDLQPTGRFVLAVLAVSNNSPSSRTIPPDLFTLTDDAGQRYLPVPGASTAYLALYERGQRGDLALEDPLDPDSGMRSIPILFDVPADATGLRLTMAGAAGAGWPISGAETSPVGP